MCVPVPVRAPVRVFVNEIPSTGCICVPVPVRAPVRLFANETPSSGLQHPSSLEEGAGKRGLECVCLSLSVTNFRINGQQSISTVTRVIDIPLRVTDLVVRRVIISRLLKMHFALASLWLKTSLCITQPLSRTPLRRKCLCSAFPSMTSVPGLSMATDTRHLSSLKTALL